jgi:hypothetical protein
VTRRLSGRRASVAVLVAAAGFTSVTVMGPVARAQDAAAPETPPPAVTAPTEAAPPPAIPPPPQAPRPPPAVAPPPRPPAPAAPYPYPPVYAYPPAYAYPPNYAYPYPPGYAYPPVYAPRPPAAARNEQNEMADAEAVVRVAAPPPGSARAPAEDPQADRGVIAPTAYTHPKGTFYISDYDLALVQLGYALTDDTQLSFTGLPPLGDERIVALDLTLKSTLYRGGLVRVAALGSASGLAAKDVGLLAVGRVGGVVQLCLERRCDSSLSLSSDVALAGVLLMVNGATGIFRVGRTLSLLGELDTLVPLGKDAGELNGGLAGGGLRLHWTNWGLDLTLMRVLGTGKATLPLLALTYRSAP